MNFRTHLFLFTILLWSASSLHAQQDPYYSHFKFVKQAYNPATVGERDGKICMSLLGHNQWVGFDDNTSIDPATGQPIQGGQITENVAPVTFNFNVGGQIKGNREKPIGALGLSMYDDRLGFMKTAVIKAQAAYFIHFNGGASRLSLAMEFGMVQFGYHKPNFHVRQPNDPKIPTSSIFDESLEIGGGIYYKKRELGDKIKDFYLGVAVSHLNGAQFNLVIPNPDPSMPGSSSVYQLDQHIYIHSGLNLSLSGGANILEPAILFKYNSKPQIDVNVTVLNKGTFRGGLGYRQWGTIDAVTLLLGYVMGPIQVGYSYDMTTSKLQTVSNGTHEIFVSYCFSPSKKGDKEDKLDKSIFGKTIREM